MDEPLELAWDEAKAAANAEKHGIRFETATEVFFAADRQDVVSRHVADPEPRSIAYGTVDGFLLAVVYTMTGENHSNHIGPTRQPNGAQASWSVTGVIPGSRRALRPPSASASAP